MITGQEVRRKVKLQLLHTEFECQLLQSLPCSRLYCKLCVALENLSAQKDDGVGSYERLEKSLKVSYESLSAVAIDKRIESYDNVSESMVRMGERLFNAKAPDKVCIRLHQQALGMASVAKQMAVTQPAVNLDEFQKLVGDKKSR